MAIDRKRFLYRLKFYLFGCALGVVVVWATLYRNREKRPSWLPEGRILEFLAKTNITITKNAECQLTCYDIPLDFLETDTIFWENAEVDFKKSAVRREPCPEHYISSTLSDGRKISIYVENCETCKDCEAEFTASLRGVVNSSDKEQSCDCE